VRIREALDNALATLEDLGFHTGGDVHLDMRLAIMRLANDSRPARVVLELELDPGELFKGIGGTAV
jgi:hypothetical protein